MRHLFISITMVILAIGAKIAMAQSSDERLEVDQTSAGVAAEQKSIPPAQQELRQEIDALKKEIEALKQASEEKELEKLRQAASAESSVPALAEESAEEPVFTSADRALQSLNPELSVVVDTGGKLVLDELEPSSLGDDSGFYFRVMGIHFETNLDPFSFLKAAVGVTPGGVGLGEAYATWTEILPNTSFTLGKFRQQFGVVNRWHVPSLDQWDFPLPLTTILGPEGLNQIGVSLDWAPPPLWAHNQVLTLQITNGMNEQLFAGQYFSIPSVLAHVRNYYDLSEKTYLELGLTGMLGWNNRRGAMQDTRQTAYDRDSHPIVFYDKQGNVIESVTVVTGQRRVDEPRRETWLGGADLTLSWVPLNRERFEGLTWRSEYFFARKKIEGDRIQAMGGYSYLDWRLSEAWVLGVRGDVTQPFTVDNSNQLIWQGVGYLTWWQSPWVKMRLQYAHRWGDNIQHRDQIIAQVVFAAGPHKHERY
ncbi:MAG: hypothetical protein JXA30_21925 [Deltaproteobacteria bacterium]|nr:hypothetical protein [Deltaproteobacteria bacterium]